MSGGIMALMVMFGLGAPALVQGSIVATIIVLVISLIGLVTAIPGLSIAAAWALPVLLFVFR